MKRWMIIAAVFGLLSVAAMAEPVTRRVACVAAILRIAEQKHLPVVRIDRALADHPDWFPDGCHPDSRGADAIAEAVVASLRH